jgi:hypothetical protein
MFLTGSTIRYARKAKEQHTGRLWRILLWFSNQPTEENECTSPERQGIAVGACGVIGLVGRSACCLDMVIADMVIADMVIADISSK